MSSPLTLWGPGDPAGLASDVPEGQRWQPQCQRLTKATFPAGAEARGKVGHWPRASR